MLILLFGFVKQRHKVFKSRLVLGTLLYTNKKEQARDLYIQTSVYTNPCIFGANPQTPFKGFQEIFLFEIDQLLKFVF